MLWGPSRRWRMLLAASVAASSLIATGIARAELEPAQKAALAAHQVVIETTEKKLGAQHFVGGLAYLVIDRTPEQLSNIVRDVDRFRELLPACIEAKLVSVSPGGVARVHLVHQLGPISGGYTMKIAFTEGGMLGRFWLEHDPGGALDDGWGFVRLTPIDDGAHTLVTWGVLFDLGPGVLRALFEGRIQKAALAYPRRLADAASR